MPTMADAGDYSSTLHYLKAVQAAGTDDTATVMAKMKATPINDMFAKGGKFAKTDAWYMICMCTKSKSHPSLNIHGIITSMLRRFPAIRLSVRWQRVDVL